MGAHVGCRRVQGLTQVGRQLREPVSSWGPVSHRSLGHGVRGILGHPRCGPTRSLVRSWHPLLRIPVGQALCPGV